MLKINTGLSKIDCNTSGKKIDQSFSTLRVRTQISANDIAGQELKFYHYNSTKCNVYCTLAIFISI